MGQIKASGTNVGCTLELPWRDNKTNISRIIPGTYGAKLRTRSDGTRVIELIGVPDRTAVQIHPANYPSELKGCIAPGKTCGKDSTSSSQKAMKEILDLIDLTRKVDASTGDVTDIVVRIR